MRPVRVYSAALTGAAGHVVTVEAGISNGPPGVVLAGLPDTALREARDRVRAAALASGEAWPERRVTVGLSPASLAGRGSGTDLAVAIAVLAADQALPARAVAGVMFFAELGLDGMLRPVTGTVPAATAAAAAGITTIVVAGQNAAEAGAVPGLRVLAADRLAAVTGWLRTGEPSLIREIPSAASRPGGSGPDLAEVPGQALAGQALEVCAAGGHHLSVTGTPRSGGRLLARRLTGIMPALDRDARGEVAAILLAAGLPGPAGGLITRPPLFTAHPSSTKTMITGGGRPAHAGAVSLAHHGVLLLDQAPEFSRGVLDALRQPLETGQVTIARRGTAVTFPARFILVLTAHPCPCGPAPADGCACDAAARRRYLGRVRGPLRDRIDVKIALPPAGQAAPSGPLIPLDPGAGAASRVRAARDRAAWRLAGTPWRLNADVPAAALRRDWAPPPGALCGAERAVRLGEVSDHGAAAVIRVAWTLADLAGLDRPGRDECENALRLRLGVEL